MMHAISAKSLYFQCERRKLNRSFLFGNIGKQTGTHLHFIADLEAKIITRFAHLEAADESILVQITADEHERAPRMHEHEIGPVARNSKIRNINFKIQSLRIAIASDYYVHVVLSISILKSKRAVSSGLRVSVL